MLAFVSFSIIIITVFKLTEQFSWTDRQTDRQRDKPTYKNSSTELNKSKTHYKGDR